ncbi:MAG TPA: RNB domain-containing ribonuclease, partial [Candidatus Cloacimonadota bacterium]|nr:RNB domain-containing ribonuclease [Candidatus Cloacimonadota bacterium]
MKYTSDQNTVIRLFEESGNYPLSYNEIVVACSATKSTKPKIKAAIGQLMELGVLQKNRKKFSLIESKPKIEPSPISKSPQLKEGTFDATSLARNYSFAFVRTPDGDFFVSSEDTLNAYHNDKVLVEPFYKQGKPDFCRVRQITERANTRMAGDIKQSGTLTIFVCSNPKIHNWFRIENPEADQEGKKVILEVTNWGNPKASKTPIGKVVEILGESGDPATELLAVIRQYQLPLEFPEAVLDALDEIPEDISREEIDRRTDLRQLFTFTVDPASAKDYDDAISLERTRTGYRLYVHIADVAHYLRVDGAIFREACQRGNSFYFPKKVIPMLPERLSNGVCSLRPEEDKLCMTVVTEFDKNANVISQRLVESVIRSDYRLSYEQVDELYNDQKIELDPKLIQALESARELSSLLTGKRMQAGYIFFDLPEI